MDKNHLVQILPDKKLRTKPQTKAPRTIERYFVQGVLSGFLYY